MTSQTINNVALDLNSLNAATIIDVRGATRVGVQLALASGSWGSAVVTFEKSIDGSNWHGFSTAVTLAAAGMVSLVVGDARFIRARVSTAAGSSATASVSDYQSDGPVTITADTPTGFEMVRKTVTENRTANTTVANDAQLVIPVEANADYTFSARIFFEGATAAQFKFRLDVPSSPTLFRNRVMYVTPSGTGNTNAMQTAATTISISSFTGTTGGFITMEGTLHNGANAGNIAFQWAQNTSDAGNTTVLKGSTIAWKKL